MDHQYVASNEVTYLLVSYLVSGDKNMSKFLAYLPTISNDVNNISEEFFCGCDQ